MLLRNVQNNDDYCFKWAIISALYPVTNHSNNCKSYKINNINEEIIILHHNDITLNFIDLNFPMSVNEIKIFEKNNPLISVNVYGLDADRDVIIGTYYHSEEEKLHHINLLLLEDISNFHYLWIKQISR